jgi:hypothetical protein
MADYPFTALALSEVNLSADLTNKIAESKFFLAPMANVFGLQTLRS